MITTEIAGDARVLVALDGSEAALSALPMARVVAEQTGARLEIVHVAALGAGAPDLGKHLRTNQRRPESARVWLHRGDPAGTILQVADDPSVVLLVLTTHGQGPEPRSFLGRTALSIVAQTTRPILLVQPEAAVKSDVPGPLRRLLLPLDGTPTTAQALSPATDLAYRLGAALHLLHIADAGSAPLESGSVGAPKYVDQPQHEWSHWAGEVAERLCTVAAACPTHVPVRVFLGQGEIGQEITRFSLAHQEDAIVLVRRSRLEAGRARTLRTVLAETHRPVIIVGVPRGSWVR